MTSTHKPKNKTGLGLALVVVLLGCTDRRNDCRRKRKRYGWIANLKGTRGVTRDPVPHSLFLARLAASIMCNAFACSS